MSDRPSKVHSFKPAAISAAICLTAFAVLWTVRQRGVLEYLELKTYDAFLRQERRDYTFSSRFLIVEITDADIEHYGYPIPDKILKALLVKLQESNPRAIGVDIVRDTPVPDGKELRTGHPLPEGWDSELKTFLQDDKNSNISWVVVPHATDTSIGGPAGISPDQLGAAETIQDNADQYVRRALIFVPDRKTGKTIPSLAFEVATQYLAGEPKPIGAESVPNRPGIIRFGPQVIEKFQPTDGAYIDADSNGYQFLLDYRGPRDFEKVKLREVLDGEKRGAVFRDKIILVGTTSPIGKDAVSTPVNDKLYGVYFQAISADQLIRFAIGGAHPITSWSETSEAAWSLGWALLGGLLGFKVRTLWHWTLACAAGIALLILAAHLEINRGVWIPILPPAVLWVTCAALVTSYISSREKQDRLVLMKLFSSQVSGAVAQEIWGNRDELLSQGKLVARELNVTVLFTDLQGFTALAQTMPPTDLMIWLNEYMAAMSKVVEKHGGIVNKYIGDAIMAVFGAPVPGTADVTARSAVACALEMRTVFGELKLGWKMRNLPDLNMRIGVHTGSLVVGTLGGADRAEYTVIGDTVNTAQRIESYNKEMMDPDISADGCRIIIGDPTQKLLNGQFRLRALGEVQLSGRKESLAIHGVIQ